MRGQLCFHGPFHQLPFDTFDVLRNVLILMGVIDGWSRTFQESTVGIDLTPHHYTSISNLVDKQLNWGSSTVIKSFIKRVQSKWFALNYWWSVQLFCAHYWDRSYEELRTWQIMCKTFNCCWKWALHNFWNSDKFWNFFILVCLE